MLVMECANIEFTNMEDKSDKSGIKRIMCIRNSGKLTRAVYAGMIVCFVPSVICQGWSRRLTFDEIYNETNYVQLHQTPRPYTLDYSHITSQNPIPDHRIILEDYRGNEIEIDYDVTVSSVVKEPLLVGFSHDPFRYSVPEEDYLKGVRKMNPKSIMMKGENRGKRGVLHLYNMMYCATGCEPLAYKGYGCYCGFLGSGRPTDGIDRCCKTHDQCYENLYCPFYTVYFQPYYWKCYRHQPLCALENYSTQHQFINGCAARLCECDRQFAMCVRKYPCPRRRALCRSSPIRLLQNLLMFR